MDNIAIAQEKFKELILSEYERIERMKADQESTDFSKLDKSKSAVSPATALTRLS